MGLACSARANWKSASHEMLFGAADAAYCENDVDVDVGVVSAQT